MTPFYRRNGFFSVNGNPGKDSPVRCSGVHLWARGFILLFLLAGINSQIFAQNRTFDEFSCGRTYIIAFPDTVRNAQYSVYADSRFNDQALVCMYSAVANSVTITSSDGLSRHVNLSAGKFTTLNLLDASFATAGGALASLGDGDLKAVYRFEADQPMYVTCYLFTPFGSEAWSPLPVETWGTNYFAAALPGDIVYDVMEVGSSYTSRKKTAPAEIMVIAAFDHTTVYVYPSGATEQAYGRPVVLNANQAYMVRSHVDTVVKNTAVPDLGGSYITSDKPIGVLSGNSRIQVLDEQSGLLKNSLKNMFLEALAPSSQYGRNFVYLPTWDNRRLTGARGEVLTDKRSREFVRAYGEFNGVTRGWNTNAAGGLDTFSVTAGTARQVALAGIPFARSFITDQPAQLMMNSEPASRLIVTNSYSTWSAYMAEMVPREQWPSFAPYYVPAVINNMENYIDVVADSNSAPGIVDELGNPFPFNQGAIAGTNLVWGTANVTAGQTHTLRGLNGERFYAVAYGDLGGIESGRATGPPNKKSVYEENLALAYGYPLAPQRRILTGSDSLRIDSVRNCHTLTLNVVAVNANASGLYSIRLDSASNVSLSSVSPQNYVLSTHVQVVVRPTDSTRAAKGQIVFEDRTGREWRVPYGYLPQQIRFGTPSGVQFGELMKGEQGNKSLTITNSSQTAETITGIQLTGRTVGITLDSSYLTFPFEIPPGASFQIGLTAAPVQTPGSYYDSVVIQLDCSRQTLPVHLQVVIPCIQLSDLDFGTAARGELKSQLFEICNRGRGTLSFNNPQGDSVVTWLGREFSVNQVYLDQLKAARLGPGQCFTATVFFRADTPGDYSAGVRVWDTPENCPDSVIWHAVVSGESGVVLVGANEMLTLIVSPNPISNVGRINISAPRSGEAIIEILSAEGKREELIFSGVLGQGSREFSFDATRLASGSYICRVTIGKASVTSRLTVVH